MCGMLCTLMKCFGLIAFLSLRLFPCYQCSLYLHHEYIFGCKVLNTVECDNFCYEVCRLWPMTLKYDCACCAFIQKDCLWKNTSWIHFHLSSFVLLLHSLYISKVIFTLCCCALFICIFISAFIIDLLILSWFISI